MKARRMLAGVGLAAGCVSVLPAHADVEINGFGQVAVGSTLGNQHSNFPNLNYGSDPSFTPESLFALQVRAPLSSSLSATAQIVATGYNGADFTPKFQWAYVSYQASDAWTIKLGRQVAPVYKYSDYAQVGQAYNWLRPPPVVYEGINNIDGISFNGYYDLGDWNFQPQLVYGNLDTNTLDAGQSVSVVFKNDTAANFSIGYKDWLSFRFGAAYVKASLSIPTLDEAISAIDDTCQIVNYVQFPGAPAPEPTCTDPNANPFGGGQPVVAPIPINNSGVASELETVNDTDVFYSGGLEIDKNNFKLISEYITSRFLNGGLFPKNRAYYVSLGYQINKVTPMLTFGHTDESSSSPGAASQVNCGTTLVPGQCGSGVPEAVEGSYVIAVPTDLYVSNLVNSQRNLSDYYELGIRWDTSAKTAIKFDYTRYLNRSGSYYGLTSTGAGNIDPYTGVNLLSAAFVFVF